MPGGRALAWLQQVQYALRVHFTTEIESYDGAIAGFEEEREHAPVTNCDQENSPSVSGVYWICRKCQGGPKWGFYL